MNCMTITRHQGVLRPFGHVHLCAGPKHLYRSWNSDIKLFLIKHTTVSKGYFLFFIINSYETILIVCRKSAAPEMCIMLFCRDREMYNILCSCCRIVVN